MGRAGNAGVADATAVRRRPRKPVDALNVSFLHPTPHETIRDRAALLAQQARARNFTHVLPTLFSHRNDIARSPLLGQIVHSACEGLMEDKQGEVLQGFARRLLTTVGAEPRSTAAIVREKIPAGSVLHLRSASEPSQTVCGRRITSEEGFHGHAPRGSFSEPSHPTQRCDECATSDVPVEPTRFEALSEAEQEEVMAVCRSAFIRALQRRKVRPNPDSLGSLTMQLQRDVRLQAVRKLHEIAARRLAELSEVQRYARWFAPFDCDDFCADARDNEYIRDAISNHYGSEAAEIPFPTLGETLQALQETFVRLPEADDKLGQFEKLFKADLIWRVWPEAIEDLKTDFHTSSPMKRYWRSRWPEAFTDIEIRVRDWDVDL